MNKNLAESIIPAGVKHPFCRLVRGGTLMTLTLLFSASVRVADAQPAKLQVSAGAGTNLSIQWNTGGALQSAASATGPWTTTSSGVTVSSAFSTPAAGPAQFYRVVDNGVAGQPVPVLPTSLANAPEVETAWIQLLSSPTPQGNTRLAVVFVPGQVSSSSSVTLLVGNQLVTLRDDGVYPDQTAGDGIFSAAINLNASDLNAINIAISALAPTNQFTEIFDQNRNLVATNNLILFPLTNFLNGLPVPIFTNVQPPVQICAGSPTAYDYHKTILITDPSVVQDPTRTWNPSSPTAGTKMGAWTFGRLMTDMANQPLSHIAPSDFVLNWIRSWNTAATINFDTVPAEPLVDQLVVQPWLAASAAEGLPANTLDLGIAPFRLLAIVNRIDLHGNTSYGTGSSNICLTPALGGEARFVFEVTDTNGNIIHGTNFTVILEYGIASNTCDELHDWAVQWANLNSIPFGGSPNLYNSSLQAITDQFATPGANPARVNGSAINHVRANDFLGTNGMWILRQWALACESGSFGQLIQTTVDNTPAASLNNTPTLEDFISANAAALCNESTTQPLPLPLVFEGQPFLGACGRVTFPPSQSYWNAPGLTPAQYCSRHGISLNTCSGCHSGETDTVFLHVSQTSAGAVASLSAFLTGETVNDPVAPGTTYHFADLDRRVEELDRLVICPCVFKFTDRPLIFVH